MDPKTTAVILQLYAPFAALLAVVFWLGVLSQRVKVAESRQNATDAELQKVRLEAIEVGVLKALLARVEVDMAKMAREMAGMQRTLANMASGKSPVITIFEQEN